MARLVSLPGKQSGDPLLVGTNGKFPVRCSRFPVHSRGDECWDAGWLADLFRKRLRPQPVAELDVALGRLAARISFDCGARAFGRIARFDLVSRSGDGD